MSTDTATALPSTADWYARNYPEHADWIASSDPRCWEVLSELGRIYNVLDRSMPDGGLRPIGGGGLTVLTCSELSTFDGSEMTGLVVAAHRLHVRVAVQAASIVGVRENPKDYESNWQRVLDAHQIDWDDDSFPRLDQDEFPTTSCENCDLMLVRAADTAAWHHDGYLETLRGDGDDLTETEMFGHPATPEDLAVEPINGRLRILVSPREPSVEGVSSMVSHPGLDRLARMADRQNAAARADHPTASTEM